MGSTPWAKSPSFECVKFSIILGAVQTPFDSKPKCFCDQGSQFHCQGWLPGSDDLNRFNLSRYCFQSRFRPNSTDFSSMSAPGDGVDQLEQSPKWTAV